MNETVRVSRIRRIFTLRNGVKVVLWTVTLLILFYVEEDWRGARAWATTKAEWEAKGESFDYAKLIPPPGPDSENLAALPLFKLERDPKKPDEWELANLRKAFREDVEPPVSVSYRMSWQSGELTDEKKLRQKMESTYRQVFPIASVPQSGLEQFDQLYPAMAELRAAAAARPSCRFLQDYPPQWPFSRLVALSTGQIYTAKILTIQGDLALSENRPDLALEAIQINARLAGGISQEPFLVSGLVAMGMSMVNFNTLYNGLALHVWNDAQLAQLERTLAGIDFLANFQKAIRGELIGIVIPEMDEVWMNPSVAVQQDEQNRQTENTNPGSGGYPFFWPKGWIDQGKVDVTTMDLGAVHLVDMKTRMVDPRAADRMAEGNDDRANGLAPWRLFHAEADPVLAHTLWKFSRVQVWVDEARIACGLERYRLAHGTYPESLEALVPASLDQLPHDIMTGDPYHYRLRPEGTFLLYSVGWNQKDDGGTEIYQKDSPQAEDKTQGDWVWPTPKAPSP